MTRATLARGVSIVLLAVALWAGLNAARIALKAELAQYLLQQAWSQSNGGTRVVRPWAWADTWPVARIVFPHHDSTLLVLDGASARNLAFGPAHVTRTPWPGAGGHTLIAGHRDTHFRILARLRMNDALVFERGGQRRTYRVTARTVVHEDSAAEIEGAAGESLLLVTCYPFDAIDAGTPWRYVVRAEPAA